MDVGRARLALSTAACLHASFWRNPCTETTEAMNASTLNGPGEQSPTNRTNGSTKEASQIGGNQRERSPDKSNDSAEDMPQAPVPAAPTALCSRPGTGSPGEGAELSCQGSCSGARRYAEGLHPQGTFSSLEKRDPEDLVGLEEEYRRLLCRFRALLPAEWFDQQQQQQEEEGKEREAGGQGDRALGEVGA